MKQKYRLVFNAPATLSFCLICLIAMILSIITGGASNRLVFSVHRTSLADPLTYVRMIFHIFGHANWSHFFGNIMYIMILGPTLEEKYGSATMIFLYVVTALVTGVVSFFLFPNVMMLGASGVVFALILLSSFTKTDRHEIPLTFILVAALYIGQQVYEAVTTTKNVAYLAHFGGGVIGAGLGSAMNRVGKKGY